MLSFDFFVAKRYLRSSKSRGFVSVIAGFSFVGIALGVATLIIVMSVMNGFRKELFDRMVGLKGHAIICGARGSIPDNKKLLSLIESTPDVVDMFPLVEEQGILFFKSKAQGVLIKGALKADLSKRSFIKDSITKEAFDKFSENSIFIGRRLAERFHIQVADSVSLLTPKGQTTAFGTLPKQRRFVVAGIFEAGVYEYDKSVVFIPKNTAQKIFGMPNEISIIELFVKNPEQVQVLTKTLGAVLGSHYKVLDWQHTDQHIFHAVQVERNVMFVILSLIVLIATFNVISGLIMLVKDKTKDIAILRTMGTTKASIMRIFFITGSSIGMAGTLFGVGVGLAFSMNIERIRQFLQGFLGVDLFKAEIYFLSKLPATVNPKEVVTIAIMSLVLSCLATLYPALKASRLDPVEGLRI